jgi:predicted aspartyl protease
LLELRQIGACSTPLQGEDRSSGATLGVGKLKRVDEKGQSSACTQQAPRNTAKVASLQFLGDSVFVDGQINEEKRTMLLDTGATKTIIRPDIVTTPTMIKPTKWRLRTATGEPAKVHGEVKVQVTLGSTNFNHQMLVADIKEEVIIGMDIMNSRGFHLDFKKGTLTVMEKTMK